MSILLYIHWKTSTINEKNAIFLGIIYFRNYIVRITFSYQFINCRIVTLHIKDIKNSIINYYTSWYCYFWIIQHFIYYVIT